jgi:hypothetical protein
VESSVIPLGSPPYETFGSIELSPPQRNTVCCGAADCVNPLTRLHGGAGLTGAPGAVGDCRGSRGHLAATRDGAGWRRPALRYWSSFAARPRSWIRAEAGTGRLLPRVPVEFGAGIALYFTADRELALPVARAGAIALCVAAFLLPWNKFFVALVLTAAVAAGFATATFKTLRIGHTVARLS